MKTLRFAHKALRVLPAFGVLGVLAAPAAHAIVSSELRVGLASDRVFPDLWLGESGLLGDSFGTKELVMEGVPTTRAAVEGNLSAGALRATAQTDYSRAGHDRGSCFQTPFFFPHHTPEHDTRRPTPDTRQMGVGT